MWTKQLIFFIIFLQKCTEDNRPLWYVFAGMGTQWHGMGRALMTLEPFYESIQRSDAVLRPYGVHLYDLLMVGDETVFEKTLNSFIGIAAIQVGSYMFTVVFVIIALKSLGLI